MSILVAIEDLMSGQVVEGTRMEFKLGWNPDTIMRSLCAFANDFENEGSGYIIIGVEDIDGKPVRPVHGFNPSGLEKVEKELVGYCNQIIPSYYPRLSLEAIDGKHVLVIWVPAGANRPYKVPDNVTAKYKTPNYRIRFQSNSIIPNDEQETELIQLTAKIPFDDRVNTKASVKELSFGLMRTHLEKTKSKLLEESTSLTIEELAEKMNLCQGAKEHRFPKNVGLLMFSENPEQYFNGAHIDVVEFPDGLGSKSFQEKTFTGPIQNQLTDVLSYLRVNVLKSKVTKYADREESDKVYNYPFAALEEAISNAVYHRNYELQDPIEIRVLPNAIEIISYNGVDPSLRQTDFDRGVVRARRYRNRRIGEFLKELRLTEGRGTGIPAIVKNLKVNGSPAPKFDTNDPDRIFFLVELLIHPAFEPVASDQANDHASDQADDHAKGSAKKFVIFMDQKKREDMKKGMDSLAEAIRKVLMQKEVPSQKVIQKYTEIAFQLNPEQIEVLRFCNSPMSNKQIQEDGLGLKKHTDNFKRYIDPLLNDKLLWRTIPNTPKSPQQKYFTTEGGRAVLYIIENIKETD